MNNNRKGVSGLIKVIDDLNNRGFYTFPAFDDHSPVDLIAMDSCGQTYRLQVKYRHMMTEVKTVERYQLVASTVHGGKRVLIDRSLIDGWAYYMADHQRVVYIPVDALKDSNTLCFEPNKNFGELDEWFKSVSC
jgi:hypothetical protein